MIQHDLRRGKRRHPSERTLEERTTTNGGIPYRRQLDSSPRVELTTNQQTRDNKSAESDELSAEIEMLTLSSLHRDALSSPLSLGPGFLYRLSEMYSSHGYLFDAFSPGCCYTASSLLLEGFNFSALPPLLFALRGSLSDQRCPAHLFSLLLHHSTRSVKGVRSFCSARLTSRSGLGGLIW
jgi:hypothetical protein